MFTRPTFTTDEKITALKRELALRKNVYAKMVREGRMKADQAAYGMHIMQAILDDYLGRDQPDQQGDTDSAQQ